VHVSRDGESAVPAALALKPHVILHGYRLAGMSGYDAARRIRAWKPAMPVRIVALTGRDKLADRQRFRGGWHRPSCRQAGRSRRPAADIRFDARRASRVAAGFQRYDRTSPESAGGGKRRSVSEVSPLRILIVEDNRDSADSLKTLLEALAMTPTSRTTANGGEVLRRPAPDVIVMDIGLAGDNGL
jgi:CheY-like chemotaxis protein